MPGAMTCSVNLVMFDPFGDFLLPIPTFVSYRAQIPKTCGMETRRGNRECKE